MQIQKAKEGGALVPNQATRIQKFLISKVGAVLSIWRATSEVNNYCILRKESHENEKLPYEP